MFGILLCYTHPVWWYWWLYPESICAHCKHSWRWWHGHENWEDFVVVHFFQAELIKRADTEELREVFNKYATKEVGGERFMTYSDLVLDYLQLLEKDNYDEYTLNLLASTVDTSRDGLVLQFYHPVSCTGSPWYSFRLVYFFFLLPQQPMGYYLAMMSVWNRNRDETLNLVWKGKKNMLLSCEQTEWLWCLMHCWVQLFIPALFILCRLLKLCCGCRKVTLYTVFGCLLLSLAVKTHKENRVPDLWSHAVCSAKWCQMHCLIVCCSLISFTEFQVFEAKLCVPQSDVRGIVWLSVAASFPSQNSRPLKPCCVSQIPCTPWPSRFSIATAMVSSPVVRISLPVSFHFCCFCGTITVSLILKQTCASTKFLPCWLVVLGGECLDMVPALNCAWQIL